MKDFNPEEMKLIQAMQDSFAAADESAKKSLGLPIAPAESSSHSHMTEAFKQWPQSYDEELRRRSLDIGIPVHHDFSSEWVMGKPLPTREEMMRPDYGDGINHSDPNVMVQPVESEPLSQSEDKFHWNYLYSIVMSSAWKVVSGLPAVVKNTQDFLEKLDFKVEVDNMPAIYNIVIAQTEPMNKYEVQLVGHFLMDQCRNHHIDFQQINFMGGERVNETTDEHVDLDIEV